MSTPPSISATQIEANKLIVRLAKRRKDWPSEPSLHDLKPQIVDVLLDEIAVYDKLFRLSRISLLLWAASGALGLIFTKYTGICVIIEAISLIMFALEPQVIVTQRYATYALTQADDIRVLPKLILATRFPWGEHPHVLYAIQRLLKQVTEEHIGLLNQDVLDRLDLLVLDPVTAGETFDYDLVQVTLKVLSKVGGDRQLRDVKAVAKVMVYNTEQQKIAHAAQDIVPVMEARLQRQQVPATLLRAADMPMPAPNTLLRAAHATPPEPSQQLLRASLSEHSETET